jgi:DNA gyrase subunit A
LKKKTAPLPQKRTSETIIPLPLDDELKHSYLDYAMSVIVSRAIPDARDGLKPVQRRILYSMLELGLKPGSEYKKSARIVGEAMGKYHPHGDSSIYEAMVRMAQPFSLRAPLVDGQGNFGSIDGDGAAAFRYTEARLSPIGEALLADLGEDTVPFVANFDDSLQEPQVLPGLLPNLLINGSTGIAVGMATNIPPHNPGEVCRAILAILDRENITDEELEALIPGPDFPTGGIVVGTSGIREAYRTGRGKFLLRGKIETEDAGRGRKNLVVTEIPYATDKSSLLEVIAKAIQSRQMEGVSDLRDESGREGIRIVLELARDANADRAIKQLYARTPLQQTFGAIHLALNDGKPEEMTLKALLGTYLSHRRNVVRRRAAHRLAKAEARLHLLEGFLVVLDRLDEAIALIRAAKNPGEARSALMETFSLTEPQATAVLDMRLQRLTALEREAIRKEASACRKDVAFQKRIVERDAARDAVVRQETEEMAKLFAGETRKTAILPDEQVEVIRREDLLPDLPALVLLSREGLLSRRPWGARKSLKSVVGASDEEEIPPHLFAVPTSTKKDILFFGSKGKVYSIKVQDVPEVRAGKGKPLDQFISVDEGETLIRAMDSDTDGQKHLFAVTRKGSAKRFAAAMVSKVKYSAGKRFFGLDEDDEILSVLPVGDEDSVIILSSGGNAIRVKAAEFRPQGPTGGGIRAIRLGKGEGVAGVLPGEAESANLVTSFGWAKRVRLDAFDVQGRGGKGLRIMAPSAKAGPMVGVTEGSQDILCHSRSGRGYVLKAMDIQEAEREKRGIPLEPMAGMDPIVGVEPA